METFKVGRIESSKKKGSKCHFITTLGNYRHFPRVLEQDELAVRQEHLLKVKLAEPLVKCNVSCRKKAKNNILSKPPE